MDILPPTETWVVFQRPYPQRKLTLPLPEAIDCLPIYSQLGMGFPYPNNNDSQQTSPTSVSYSLSVPSPMINAEPCRGGGHCEMDFPFRAE